MNQHFSTRPAEVFLSFWRHRALILQMSKREVVGRYRGSFLGVVWSFITPVLMLAIYTFFFSVVFKARWGQEVTGRYEFALILFVGLLLFNLFSECLTRAPGLILNNVTYVKKVVFPLEILPWVALGSGLFHAAAGGLIFLVFFAMVHGSIHWTVILLPMVLLPLMFLIVGFSWMLASIGVFVRDIAQPISMAMTALLFMSPIFYPISALPESVRQYVFINPLTFAIEQTRNLVLWGRLPDWRGLGIYAICCLCVCWLGLFWFQKTRKGFADVL